MSATTERFTDAQRMELRSYVQLAGEVISQYWPMRTFIHHNPLHGMETLPFEQAVQHGRQLFGGRGYLPGHEYRRHLSSGRITGDDLRAVLAPLARDEQVRIAGKQLSHLEILTASMVHGLAEDLSVAPTDDDAPLLGDVQTWLRTTGACLGDWQDSNQEPVRDGTLSEWCDRTLGTDLVATINREMVKWCSVFLDEGEASWVMPHRDQTFFRAWKLLARHDLSLKLIGIHKAATLIEALPDRPEDAVLEQLQVMTIAKARWEPYLSLHLSALPGWTGYVKWRAQQNQHPYQQSFPMDLVKYLAVRLFYERHLVEAACRSHLGVAGEDTAVRDYEARYPQACLVRRDWVAGRLDAAFAQRARSLASSRDHEQWNQLGLESARHHDARRIDERIDRSARRLLRLVRGLGLNPCAVESTSPSDVSTLLGWIEEFSPDRQSPVWLEAFESHHRQRILDELTSQTTQPASAPVVPDPLPRPLAQVVFCIDVRSEVYRRHLEHRGGYETLGLAGFFGVPLDYQPFHAHQAVAHCPVLLKPKNQVREIPRSYHSALAEQHKRAEHLRRAAHELLHDLKENVVTPYIMVEAIGWLFGLPLFGKTLFPVWHERIGRWMTRWFTPALATTLTVEKLAREEAEEMVATEQLAIIREVVRQRFGLTGAALNSTLLDKIRKKSIGHAEGINGDVAHALALTPEAESAFYEELRDRYRISPRGISAHLERLTHTGFSVAEQAYFVEAALRLMGLTSNFSRVVLFCAHGSTSQNNPYESALDCGACGGNHGLPNARAIAAMANKAAVRALLQERSIKIPADTHFFAAEHDTTTDAVRIVDLEDVPATHRKDLQRLLTDLEHASDQAALERAVALSTPTLNDPATARQAAERRSQDWAEVRPEWGLSKNSVLIIGRRVLTQQVNLQGRSFLHSYDHAQDQTGKLLETIMTAPLVVAQWINMEHYFSTVDNDVYGSGSKVYHNVVGRVGVMTGAWSDLRLGLPAQTVLDGARPYHEPMRLLAVIEAPRERIQGVIDRHPLLDQLFNLGWVTLVALEPKDRLCYRYDRGKGWLQASQERGGPPHDWADVTPDERDQDRRPGRSAEVCH